MQTYKDWVAINVKASKPENFVGTESHGKVSQRRSGRQRWCFSDDGYASVLRQGKEKQPGVRDSSDSGICDLLMESQNAIRKADLATLGDMSPSHLSF